MGTWQYLGNACKVGSYIFVSGCSSDLDCHRSCSNMTVVLSVSWLCLVDYRNSLAVHWNPCPYLYILPSTYSTSNCLTFHLQDFLEIKKRLRSDDNWIPLFILGSEDWKIFFKNHRWNHSLHSFVGFRWLFYLLGFWLSWEPFFQILLFKFIISLINYLQIDLNSKWIA